MKKKSKMNKNKREELLSRKEAAIFLSISLSTLKNWTYSKEIIGYKLGGKVYYKKQELINALKPIN